MTLDKNPQAEQVAHESMVRNLAAQAEAIWPQEREILLGYGLPRSFRGLDVGCGTGEFTRRLAKLFPQASLLGVDLYGPHLDLAREVSATLSERVAFQEGDAFQLGLGDATQDFASCRHMLQSVPHPEKVVDEMIRVLKPGGRIHLLGEVGLDLRDFLDKGIQIIVADLSVRFRRPATLGDRLCVRTSVPDSSSDRVAVVASIRMGAAEDAPTCLEADAHLAFIGDAGTSIPVPQELLAALSK